jgi:phosphatidylglycerophosphate synthase
MDTLYIDARDPSVPLDTRLGGLTLPERAIRTARASGYDDVVFVTDDPDAVLALTETPASTTNAATDGVPMVRVDALHSRGTPPEAIVRLRSDDDVAAAEKSLWDSCRKDVDGIISRHLNRSISLAISRRLAPLGVRPNQVTVVTFTLGILSGVVAAVGGWAAFALGGLLFQLTSVLDGVDGELARVKFEGSVLGEWFDTISDDTSDVAFYGGVGLGAWRSGYELAGLSPDVWLVLGIVAAVGKLASMAVYYRWLAARGRGDLYAFSWSFDEEPDASSLNRMLSVLRYATKNDFIAFAAMILGFVGWLPWLLAAAAPGTWVVAASALAQGRNGDVT